MFILPCTREIGTMTSSCGNQPALPNHIIILPYIIISTVTSKAYCLDNKSKEKVEISLKYQDRSTVWIPPTLLVYIYFNEIAFVD